MSVALDILGWVSLSLGAFFCVVGAIGLHRMPDVFTRMHATSVSDTLGVGFLLLGMLAQTDDWLVAVRLVVIGFVLYVTGAVASHALARAALHDGRKPMLVGDDGLQETDCADIYPELAVRIATPLVSEQAEGGLGVNPDADADAGSDPDANSEDEKEGAPSNS
ncbi:MAG: monovalent cation/H(+) antiporter subunit G [Pseudomonadota bacterium]